MLILLKHVLKPALKHDLKFVLKCVYEIENNKISTDDLTDKGIIHLNHRLFFC